MSDEKAFEVWIQLKGREKMMLVNLTKQSIEQLSVPGAKIEGIRINKNGEETVVGFNSADLITYEYKKPDGDVPLL